MNISNRKMLKFSLIGLFFMFCIGIIYLGCFVISVTSSFDGYIAGIALYNNTERYCVEYSTNNMTYYDNEIDLCVQHNTDISKPPYIIVKLSLYDKPYSIFFEHIDELTFKYKILFTILDFSKKIDIQIYEVYE